MSVTRSPFLKSVTVTPGSPGSSLVRRPSPFRSFQMTCPIADGFQRPMSKAGSFWPGAMVSIAVRLVVGSIVESSVGSDPAPGVVTR